MSITDHMKQRYGHGSGWNYGDQCAGAELTRDRSAITDHRIRAAVWCGIHTGTWHVDVYYAERRGRVYYHPDAGLWRRVGPVERAAIDGAKDAVVIQRTFEDRAAALTWAERTVAAMRSTVAIAAGALATDDALAALDLATIAPGEALAAFVRPDPMEAP